MAPLIMPVSAARRFPNCQSAFGAFSLPYLIEREDSILHSTASTFMSRMTVELPAAVIGMQLIICPDSLLCSALDLLQLILLRYSSAQLAFCADTVCKVGAKLLDSCFTVLFAAHLVSLTNMYSS